MNEQTPKDAGWRPFNLHARKTKSEGRGTDFPHGGTQLQGKETNFPHGGTKFP